VVPSTVKLPVIVTSPETVPPEELNLLLAAAKAPFAYDPALTAFWSAVLAAAKAALAYVPEVTALWSAVLAAVKEPLAYEPALTAF